MDGTLCSLLSVEAHMISGRNHSSRATATESYFVQNKSDTKVPSLSGRLRCLILNDDSKTRQNTVRLGEISWEGLGFTQAFGNIKTTCPAVVIDSMSGLEVKGSKKIGENLPSGVIPRSSEGITITFSDIGCSYSPYISYIDSLHTSPHSSLLTPYHPKCL